MTKRIECFWLEPSEVAECRLRRYGAWDSCTDGNYHNASVSIGRKPYPKGTCHGEYSNFSVDKTDPRWPTHCDRCGYAFQDSDEWQRGVTRLYQRDNGELYALSEAPVGAMWDADWYKGIKGFDHGQSEVLVVKTPGGDWVVDGPSKDGGNWTRTGTVPHVTVAPSIVLGGYHAFLRGGFLEEC